MILRKTDLWGSSNQTMVTSILNLYNNNTISRGLTIFKNRYYPLIYDVIDDTGNNTFLPPQDVYIDAEVKAFRLNNTSGNMTIDLTDLTNNGNMVEGYFVEFWFKQISKNGVVNKFMDLGYWNGSSTDYASFNILSNGIQFNCGQPIESTSNSLNMFDWMYIAVWRQNSTWFLLVSQKNVDYLSSPMVNGFDVKGIKEFRLVAGPAQGVVFYIRDIFVSDGREYNKDSISVNANKFWNHGCDAFSGVPAGFESVPLFITPTGTVYTFIGNHVAHIEWNNAVTTVVGSKVFITFPTYWTFELDIKKGPPVNSNEYYFVIANSTNTGRGIDFNSYSSFNNFYSSSGSDVFVPDWSGFASFKLVRDSTGMKVFMDGVLKGTMPHSTIVGEPFSCLYMGSYFGGTTTNGTQMRNIKIYESSA